MTNEKSKETMTKKQKTFAKKYVTNFIGSEAYMFAYETSNRKSASVQACKLLKIPKIKEYIEAYVQEQLGPLEKDLLGNVKFWIEIRNDTDARPADRLKASEMLAKYRSMFVEKKEVSLEAQVRIVDDIPDK